MHKQDVERLQKQMHALLSLRSSHHIPFIAPHYHFKHSFTMRSKSYRHEGSALDCSAFNRVLDIDTQRNVALVEPSVTMDRLVQETIKHGLAPMIVPEFKTISVGGAIMGIAGESGSHRLGCFNDICLSYELLQGDGSVLKVSAQENPDIFYGLPGSYGSLGPVLSAEIQLAPIKDVVHLQYKMFRQPQEAIQALIKGKDNAEFLDGIIFFENLAVMIAGNLRSFSEVPKQVQRYSPNRFAERNYVEHVHAIAQEENTYEEVMTPTDYFFRYDPGAYWMGNHLYRFSFIERFLREGVFHLTRQPSNHFSEAEIKHYRPSLNTSYFKRMLLHPFMSSDFLCKLMHQAQDWVRSHFIVQDCCIPDNNAPQFYEEVIRDPGIFPIWLLPIKGTKSPQIFAPHLIKDSSSTNAFMNFGLYGIPSLSAPMDQILKRLENNTAAYGGRKVLYSQSTYTPEEFWRIYPQAAYQTLRNKTHSEGIYQDITSKVLNGT